MSHEVAVLKIKILKNNQGFAAYPNFNTLASVISSGMDWSKYVDTFGSGWLYDVVGHDEETADSPRGQQWGMIMCPVEFVDEAVTAFPGLCTRMTEVQAEEFYRKQHARDVEDEEVDVEILDAIKRKKDLGIPLTPGQLRAIDPRDKTRGVRENRRKKFTNFKADRGFDVIDPA
jgi:hypothetical protein